MVHSSFSVSVRVFAAVSPVSFWCGGILHPLNVCLRSVFSDPGCENTTTEGVWRTATIFFSLKLGIPKVGSGITSKFLGY